MVKRNEMGTRKGTVKRTISQFVVVDVVVEQVVSLSTEDASLLSISARDWPQP
jgi:hypothetical protein